MGTVTYSLAGDDAADFTVNTSTGAVSMVARNYESPVDANTDNIYQYTLVVTDGDNNTASDAVAVTVTDVTETANLTLSDTADSSVSENAAYSASAPSLTGGPVGTVTYSLAGDDAADFTVNTSTGAVSMVARNYESPVDANTDNIYQYTLVVTDGDNNTASDAVAVTVTDVTETANLTLSDTADSSVSENAAYSASAPSLTGGPVGTVTYSLAGDDAADFTVNTITGAVSMVARNYESPVDANTDNIYQYTLVVTDGDNNTASDAVAVTVTDVTGDSET